MLVLYRIADVKSPLSAPPPILADNIYGLATLCLNFFVMAFTGEKIKMHFIMDFCDKRKWKPLIDAVPFDKTVEWTGLGINGTCLRQYEVAKEATDETLLFNEYDYLWLPQSGKKMVAAIKHFGLLSPYDHKNFYLDPSIHSKKTEIELFEDHHYRTTERNTMTFGMTRDVFTKQFEILNRWGYLDNDVWKEMKVNGNPLWTPLPSFATHMVKDFLAPGIDWQQLWTILMPKT